MGEGRGERAVETNFVIHITARLTFLLILALAPRAASAQPAGGDPYSPALPAAQPDPQRYPINVQSPAFRFGSNAPQSQATAPTQQPPAAPPPTDPQRYPLPSPTIAAPPLPNASPQPPAPSPQPASAGHLFQPAQIVATVGNKYIFYGDVAPMVNQMLQPALAKAPSEFERQQIEKYRDPLTRQAIRQMVETKLMYLEFEREIVKNAPKDKLPEVRKNIDKKVFESFEQELADTRAKIDKARPEELPELLKRDPIVPRLVMLMKDVNAESLGELDAALRQFGSTLEKEVRYYGEYKLGRTTVGKHINFKPEITHQEMLDYYHEHAADYAVPAKVRFEILTVKFESFPTRQAAQAAIAAMGNEVFFGAPFKAVAQKGSQEPNAQAGGYYDWTSQGSLASQPIDEALFTIETGKLSQIIEDNRGLHIVRVIERSPAGQVSFLEAQPKIKEAITTQKKEADYKKFVQTLGVGTRVWTIYDDQAEPTATARQQGGTQPR
jgi:parvulin-like peptidyl-prolyl isomerase